MIHVENPPLGIGNFVVAGTSGSIPYIDSNGKMAQNNTSLFWDADGTFLRIPKIVGGTGTTQDLTFQTTTGVGTTGADMHFLVGNNGATEAMTILNDGKVGIGITTPISPLHLYENTTQVNSAAGFTIEQDGTGDAVIQWLTTGANRWVMGIDNSDVDKLKISPSQDVGTTAVFSISTSGDIGVGTTDPNGILHLDNGTSDTDLIIEKDAGTAADIIFHNAGAAAAHIAFDSNEDILIENDTQDKDIIFKVDDGGVDIEVIRVIGSTRNVAIGATTAGRQEKLGVHFTDNTVYSTSGTGFAETGLYVINESTTNGVITPIVFGGKITNQALSVIGSVTTANNESSLVFMTEDSNTVAEKMRINNSGDVLIGSTQNDLRAGQKIGIVSTAFGGMAFSTYSTTDANSSILDFNKSGNATPGSHTLVANGEALGNIIFRGSDGTNFEDAASIRATVDGTAADDDMPGTLIFSTTASGAVTASTRMVINSAGNIGIGTSAIDGRLHLDAGTADTDLIIEKDDGTAADIIFHNAGVAGAHIAFDSNEDILIENDTADKDIIFKVLDGVADTEVMRIDGSTSRVGIGTAVPLNDLHIEGANDPTIRVQDTTNDVIVLVQAQDSLGFIGTGSNHPYVFVSNSVARGIVSQTGLFGFGTTAPASLVDIDGPIGTAILTVTGNTTLDGTHSTLLANATGNITITLPTAASSYNSTDDIGRIYRIKKIDADADTVTIDGNGSETIDGGTTAVLTTQYESIDIQSDGSNWHIL